MASMLAGMLAPWQASALDALATLMLITTAVIALTRSITLAIKTYIVQACILVTMFAVLGVRYEWFIGWAFSATITKAVIVPWVLLWVVRKTSYVSEKEEPIISSGAFAFLLLVIYAFSGAFARHFTTSLQSLAALGVPSLTSAIALICVGLSVVTLSRNAVKQILGIILFENGSHITLACIAFYVPETVEIGIVSDAVVLVVVLSVLAYRLVRIRGDMDVSKLTVLRG